MTATLLFLALNSMAIQDLGGFDQASYMEEKLAKWKPAASYLVPEGTLQSNPKDLVGEWNVSSGMDGTTVNFVASESGAFSVKFRTGGCLGSWTLHRTATLKDGIVQLNRAVESYCREPYDRYFFVKRGEVLWLVPAAATERGKMLMGESGYGTAESWFEFFSLRKKPVSVG